MKEVGKRRSIFYGITGTFTSRDWATQGVGQPNNVDETRDFKNGNLTTTLQFSSFFFCVCV